MGTVLIVGASFVGVTALVGGVALMFRGTEDSLVLDRLEVLTNTGKAGKSAVFKNSRSNLLVQTLDREQVSTLERVISRFLNLRLFLDQAHVGLQPVHFIAISLGLLLAGMLLSGIAGVHLFLAPLVGIGMSVLPFVFCYFKRKRRLEAFQRQLPDALELLARALRAGHSLAAGFKLIADEMPQPLGNEFGRVYEEQNLGVAFEDALESMSTRIPNLDLRFFATAIVLQRQTGGDLAQILDKIGRLIRERFKIWGQIQALTGEGRISGVVLLGLCPLLFVAIYRVNPEYVRVLFDDPLGKKMLASAICLQFVGALVIRKIIDIKV
jgi:tight adherence protein B